jgi:proteasomal ATPase-associated factor 1
MCIKIWSVEDGSCPVTLKGHKRGVTALDMIDRGKQVVSSSLGEIILLLHVFV